MKKVVLIVGIFAVIVTAIISGMAYFLVLKNEKDANTRKTEPARKAQEAKRNEKVETKTITSDEEKTIV